MTSAHSREDRTTVAAIHIYMCLPPRTILSLPRKNESQSRCRLSSANNNTNTASVASFTVPDK